MNMRRILLFFTMILAAMIMFSCKSTLPARFDAFVSSVEKNCSTYSQDDWTKANDKFEKLFNEYKENRTAYNSDEQKQINSAIARYAKAAAKSGIDQITSVVNDITSQLPGLIENAKSILKDLGLTK